MLNSRSPSAARDSNVRLANRLVDWNIDVKNRAQVADMDLAERRNGSAALFFGRRGAGDRPNLRRCRSSRNASAAALAEQGVERIERSGRDVG